MKLKPFYNTEGEIPADQKQFYVQVGERWELDGGEETLGAYYNAALDAKKKELKTEKEAEKNAKETAQREITRLNNEVISKLQSDLTQAKSDLATAKTPGMTAIPDGEVKELRDFRQVGSLKDVKDKVKLADEYTAIVIEHVGVDKKPDDLKTALAAKTALEQENATHKRDQVLREAAEKAEFNFSVLRDLVTHPERGAGLESIIVKDVTGEDRTVTRQPFAIIKGDGEAKIEKPLGEYAGARTDWQPYMTALKGDGNGKGGPTIIGGDPTDKNKKTETAVDKMPGSFNAARSTRRDPFSKAGPAKDTGTGTGAGAGV